MNSHPLRPAFEAINTTIGRGVSYVVLWFLGAIIAAGIHDTWRRLIEGEVRGVSDGLNGGILAFMLIAHPLGWLIIAANVLCFPIFIRFKVTLWLLLLPLVSSLAYALFILNEFK